MSSVPARSIARACGAALLALLASPLVADSLGELDVAVFEAVLTHGLESDESMLVLDAVTTGDPAAIGEHVELARGLVGELGAPGATLDDWLVRNADTVTIDQPLDLPVSYHLLDADERAEIFAAPEPQLGWSQFFERFRAAPGLVRLSRVGRDAGARHALVYVEHQCGVECGAGRLVHLARDDTAGWRVAGAVLVWMIE
ncbi:MAG: hypothetical protein RLW61_23315 [Gammaproteobacteria bacterium]